MERLITAHPGEMGMLAFFILGWSYYMVATILMRGSIFIPLRDFVQHKAEGGSWFFLKAFEMFGCLMCTATEAAIWTLGISTFFLGLKYHVVHQILHAITRQPTDLLWPVEIILMAGISFALSVAVSGVAWAISRIAEYRERQFLALQKESRTRELELLGRINELELGQNENNFEFVLEDEHV